MRNIALVAFLILVAAVLSPSRQSQTAQTAEPIPFAEAADGPSFTGDRSKELALKGIAGFVFYDQACEPGSMTPQLRRLVITMESEMTEAELRFIADQIKYMKHIGEDKGLTGGDKALCMLLSTDKAAKERQDLNDTAARIFGSR